MTRWTCISAYRSALGTWKPGDAVELQDADLALLLRDSPGSFAEGEASVTNPEPVAEPEPEVDAMSRETASGLTVPDRQLKAPTRKRRARKAPSASG